MRNRIIVHLLPGEKEALQAMAEQDTRPPAAQIRHLLVTEAAKRGIRIVNTESLKNKSSAPIFHGERTALGV